MTHKIVSLRVYKDEYQKSFVLFLSKSFQSEETDNVLTLTGITEEVANSIISLQFKGELEIQKVFPQYQTLYDVEMAYRKKVIKAFGEMRDALIELSMSDAFKSLSKDEYTAQADIVGLDLIQHIATEQYQKFLTYKLD